jgi:hypothetical protein
MKRTIQLQNVSMFDTPLPDPPAAKPAAFPGPRTIRRVLCAGGAHQAGLIIDDGKHLVWRPHTVTMANGSTWSCPAVGYCLCQMPAPTVKDVYTPTCERPTYLADKWSW